MMRQQEATNVRKVVKVIDVDVLGMLERVLESKTRVDAHGLKLTPYHEAQSR